MRSICVRKRRYLCHQNVSMDECNRIAANVSDVLNCGLYLVLFDSLNKLHSGLLV